MIVCGIFFIVFVLNNLNVIWDLYRYIYFGYAFLLWFIDWLTDWLLLLLLCIYAIIVGLRIITPNKKLWKANCFLSFRQFWWNICWKFNQDLCIDSWTFDKSIHNVLGFSWNRQKRLYGKLSNEEWVAKSNFLVGLFWRLFHLNFRFYEGNVDEAKTHDKTPSNDMFPLTIMSTSN